MWCQDTFILPGRQWHYVTLRRRVCISRPADKMKAHSLYVQGWESSFPMCVGGMAGALLKITAAESAAPAGWARMLCASVTLICPYMTLTPSSICLLLTSAGNRCSSYSRLLLHEGLLRRQSSYVATWRLWLKVSNTDLSTKIYNCYNQLVISHF